MPSQTVLLLGGTGAVGKQVLRELLASEDYSQVFEAGRRVTSAEVIQQYEGKEKLKQKVINFDRLAEAGLQAADVLIITLGTTKADAGSAVAFERIDRFYPVEAAKAARDPSKRQRLIYLSSAGASASSSFLYTRSKGLTEQELSSLAYDDFIVFRPGLLANAQRDKPRIAETIAGAITGFMANWTPHLEIKVDRLARSIVRAATLGSQALPAVVAAALESPHHVPPYTIVSNKGALALAEI